MAPGVDIVAAVAPGPNPATNFDFESGTSMSSPAHRGPRRPDHGNAPEVVADGDQVGADDHAPTRHDRPTPGAGDTDPFDHGAGLRQPELGALDPGLVYDSDVVDWVQYLAAAASSGVDTGLRIRRPIDPSDLNCRTSRSARSPASRPSPAA